MWHRVLIACILLQTVIKSDQQPQFLVIFPAQLQSLTTAKVCAHVFNIDRSFILTITLQNNMNNQTLFLDTIVGSSSSQAPSYYKCVSFQVPLIPQVVNQNGSVAVMMVRARDRQRNVIFEQAKQVFIIRPASGTFVQTDKPVYLRGDKVRCRIVSLDSKLIPQNDEYSLIELKDPDGNRIGQWSNLRPQQGIAEISFQLTSEAMLGDYIFQLTKEKGEDIYQIFTVDTHVLPKFEILIFAPKVVTLSESQFQVFFCGSYIYRKPVTGTIKATICRVFYSRIPSNIVDSICQEYSGQINFTRCFATVVLTEDFLFGLSNQQSYFSIQASLEEDGTGITVTHSENVPISEFLVKIEFLTAEKYYRTGTPFTGKLVMQRSDGTRVSFQPVYLRLVSNSSDVRRYVTDADGTASFSLDTTSWTGPKELRASYFANSTVSEKYEGARLDLQQFYSNTQSYLTIQQPDNKLQCGETVNIEVDYAFTKNELIGTLSQSISYLVITRGEIIVNGQHNIPPEMFLPQYVARGSFYITLPISPAVAPTASLLAYAVLPAGAVMAQRADLKVSKCFTNKVYLKFSKNKVLPGSNVSLTIQAAPNSLCALRAIDRSIFLLKPEMEITADFVYSILKPQEFSGYPLQVDEFFYNPCYPFNDIYDTFYIFKMAGMKVITNCDMKKPLRCNSRSILDGSRFNGPVSEWSSALFVPPPNLVKSQTRTDFSEAWIWQLETIGNLEKSITLPIPDTVTQWEASMFCTASTGFGVAHTVSVVTFKPFFLEPLLPYSVIRGESFELKAKVFNYLQDCIMVQIRLLASASYTSVSNPNHQYTTCLCANKEKTVSWTVTPITLGVINITVRAQAVLSSRLCGSQIPNLLKEYDVDTVVKTLLVVPEGRPVAFSKTSMICVNNTSVKEEVDFQIPPNVINGSARGEIIVIGDIMGTAMQNIEMLLQVPYGCGEQNLVSFAVDVSVLRYLKATNHLTSQAKQQWSLFLQKGYQKQLNFKNSDCSFSGFGPKDTEEGSLWLTAFVASQFAKASEFTFIDGNVIDCAVQWILQKQLENGCFERTGRIFQPSLKTAVNDDISLSAYVCYSLQELPNRTAQIDSIISNCLRCLRDESRRVSNPYTMALLANVFRYPEDASYQRAMLGRLDQLATKEAGKIYWTLSQNSAPNSAPVEVELAGYVMSAYLTKANVISSDIGYAAAIARWMVSKQGPSGGFQSTQDTVVGFDALAKYATIVSGGELQAMVRIYKQQQVLSTFEINRNNRLQLHRVSIKEIPASYSYEVTGKGCVFLQTILRCNVIPVLNQSNFTIDVVISPLACTPAESETPSTRLNITVRARYVGQRLSTNMVIVEMTMQSGFNPEDASLDEIFGLPLVKKIAYENQMLTVYVDEMRQLQLLEFSLIVKQDFIVNNLRLGTIRIYDYYATEESAITQYGSPCGRGDN